MTGTVPEGFVKEGLSVMRRSLLNDLKKEGCRKSDDHYITIAFDCIWNCYVDWKNRDSNLPAGWWLSHWDIAAGCRKRNIPYDMDDFDLNIVMKHHSYRFTHCYREIFGGPVDSNGDYPGTNMDSGGLGMTSRTFFKLLSHFDRVIDSAVPALRKGIADTCAEFRTGQIMSSTLSPLLESGLEDLDYRYTCVSDEDGDKVLVYLHYQQDVGPFQERVLELKLDYDTVLKNVNICKGVIRYLLDYPLQYKKYPECRMRFACDPDIPPKSTVKRF